MITRAQMPRQLRDKGGIASVTPRKKYGLGSKIKERFRKLIPNELADVAVKAAPFVAPFNPGVAGLMRGIGRFDQRGSISDALKQGAATFGFGAATRALGGADPFGGGLKGGFTSPLDAEKTTKLKTLFEKEPKKLIDGKEREGSKLIQKGVDTLKEKIPLLENVKDDVAQKLLVGGITAGASALYSYFAGEFEPQEPGETMEEYMARRRESVKTQMRSVMDSYYTPLRNPQYAAMTPEQKDNFIDGIVGQGMAAGGRVELQQGGIMPRLNELGTKVSSAEETLQDINRRLESADTSLGNGGGTDMMNQDSVVQAQPGSNNLFFGRPVLEMQGQPRPISRGGPGPDQLQTPLRSALGLAKGGMPTGIMRTNKAGVMERDYRDKGGFVPVGIKEKADDVPAMLSKNEFVFTADAVRGAGNGSIEKGAQRMYDTMKNLEKRVV
jgi:hypothetical protein